MTALFTALVESETKNSLASMVCDLREGKDRLFDEVHALRAQVHALKLSNDLLLDQVGKLKRRVALDFEEISNLKHAVAHGS